MKRPAPNPALYYSAPDYSTGGERLMGKHAANEGFLKAYVEHSGQEHFVCYTQTEKGFQHFQKQMQQFATPRTPTSSWIEPSNLAAIREVGCLFIPSSQVDELTWPRRRIGQKAYSVCGLTHTMASQGPMQILRNIVFYPTQPWDALICTSKSVKACVEYVVQQWIAYFCQRFHVKEFTLPIRLPVIPLGVNTAQFLEGNAAQSARDEWRKQLKIGDDDVVFLFIGRLSAHAKAHPVAMYRALELAAQKSKRKFHLIQAGWFANDGIRKAFEEGARVTCPSVRCIFVDGRQQDVRKKIWYAADVFTSLSENIQETFGLTPIEAKAAGLPLVITDWDGYRETVRHEVDGFRIPTMAPAPGMSEDISLCFELGIDNYDHYLANCCQVTSVDISLCAEAYHTLAENPDLRKKMGEAGRQHAREIYDWKHVIRAYQDLWQELSALRQSNEEISPAGGTVVPHPAFDDPFAIHANYPTDTLRTDALLRLTQGYEPDDFKKIRALQMNRFGKLAPEGQCVNALKYIAKEGQASLGDVIRQVPEKDRMLLARSMLWCAKVGMLSIGDHNS
ncbi:MAG: glycosyltransferase family 4 protein [Hyphomicrobiales bacterium]|nr:glycosyltransferase family 4 protein [Rickettsiales bacterium]MCP5361641.1 glycosyltransferase family 4 protein [Hyphomicrobiales bacterium]